MGWGQGIGIGWPNSTSGSNQPQMVCYVIQEVCGGAVPPDSTTQFVWNYTYQTGDYVDSGDVRVLLGPIAEGGGLNVYNISGPVYTSCP